MAITFAVIGGSGLYDLPDVNQKAEHNIETPYGPCSGPIVECEVNGESCFFLPRHGKGHVLLPNEVPVKANIWALKKLGVTDVIAVSAVGSLRERIKPGHIVIIDQFIDRTRKRPETFFGGGIVGHVPFADPICSELAGYLCDHAMMLGLNVHRGGAYVNIEGPQFSTRAESHLYRSFGADVVGMTLNSEARLAREAELGFAAICLATDYDCWHESEEDVSAHAVMETLKTNVQNAKNIVAKALAGDFIPEDNGIKNCLDVAIMTDKSLWPKEKVKEIEPIIQRLAFKAKQ